VGQLPDPHRDPNYFRQKRNKNPQNLTISGIFLELLSRFELETSSLPKTKWLFLLVVVYCALSLETYAPQPIQQFLSAACRFLLPHKMRLFLVAVSVLCRFLRATGHADLIPLFAAVSPAIILIAAALRYKKR